MKKVNYQIEEKGIYIKYSLLVPNMKKVWQLLNNDLPKVGAVNITIEAVK
jgi:lipase chaperone LimK